MYLPTYLLTYLSTYLPTYPPTHLHCTYLPTSTYRWRQDLLRVLVQELARRRARYRDPVEPPLDLRRRAAVRDDEELRALARVHSGVLTWRVARVEWRAASGERRAVSGERREASGERRERRETSHKKVSGGGGGGGVAVAVVVVAVGSKQQWVAVVGSSGGGQ